MKYLVETTGEFMLSDRLAEQEVAAERPSVVIMSNFMSLRVGLNQIKILGKVSDKATDDEFLKFWRESEGDSALAVESFISAFEFVEVSAKGAQPELPLKKGKKS
jgi:uncharacterized protein YfeS